MPYSLGLGAADIESPEGPEVCAPRLQLHPPPPGGVRPLHQNLIVGRFCFLIEVSCHPRQPTQPRSHAERDFPEVSACLLVVAFWAEEGQL